MNELGRNESRGKPWGFVGAILLTGYLGGAIAAHLRAGSSVFQMEGRRLPWLRALH